MKIKSTFYLFLPVYLILYINPLYSEETNNKDSFISVKAGERFGSASITNNGKAFYAYFDTDGKIMLTPSFGGNILKINRATLKYMVDWERFRYDRQNIDGKSVDIGTSVYGDTLFVALLSDLGLFIDHSTGLYFAEIGFALGYVSMHGDAYLVSKQTTSQKDDGELAEEPTECQNNRKISALMKNCEYRQFDETFLTTEGGLLRIGYKTKYVMLGIDVVGYGKNIDGYRYQKYYAYSYISANLAF